MSQIKSINFPANRLSDLGLNSVKMTGLGKLIVIAGRNGAGKSRILKSILQDGIDLRQIIEVAENMVPINLRPANVETSISALRTYDLQVGKENPNTNGLVCKLNVITAAYDLANPHQLNAVEFFPKSDGLMDPEAIARRDITQHAKSASTSMEPQAAANYTLPYLQSAQDSYYEAKNQAVETLSQEERDAAIEHYEGIAALVELLLHTKIGRKDRSITLFGRATGDLALSTGQTILLKLAVRLHAQELNLSNTIAIIDEPENHLHPDAVQEIIETLISLSGNLQIIIATHSVPLIAYAHSVDSRALWYLSDGMIEPGTKQTLSVLRSLLGGPEQIDKLSSFLSLPAELAASNFAVQSLFPPGVHGGGEGDPQTEQVARGINALQRAEKPVLLDFGAGKGRLLNGIASYADFQGRVAEALDYIAFDVSKSDEQACKQTIRDYYEESTNRWYCKRTDLFEDHGENFADVVVMCNVLHEIEPFDWIKILGKNSDIFKMLKPDGELLIVEDQLIPVGEKAHKNGFLVLDTLPLHKLFRVGNADKGPLFWKDDARKDGRLTAHHVKRELLERVCLESWKDAIDEQHKISIENLQRIRAEAPTYAAGRQSGFYLQTIGNIALIRSAVPDA
ncbi:MAG: AAA family ATPase [Polaromonas sp.]|nr:AAA family ATPase [Polaromonas sp.]